MRKNNSSSAGPKMSLKFMKQQCGPKSSKKNIKNLEDASKAFMSQHIDNHSEEEEVHSSQPEDEEVSDAMNHSDANAHEDDDDSGQEEEEEKEAESKLVRKSKNMEKKSTGRKNTQSGGVKNSSKRKSSTLEKEDQAPNPKKTKKNVTKDQAALKRKIKTVEALEEQVKQQLKLAEKKEKLERMEERNEKRQQERAAKQLEKERLKEEAIENGFIDQKLNFFKTHDEAAKKYINRNGFTLQFKGKCYGPIQSCKEEGKFGWNMKDFSRVVYLQNPANVNGLCQVFKRIPSEDGELSKTGKRKFIEVPEEGEFIQPPTLLPEIEEMFQNYFDMKGEATWKLTRELILKERQVRDEVRRERLALHKRMNSGDDSHKVHENVLMDTN